MSARLLAAVALVAAAVAAACGDDASAAERHDDACAGVDEVIRDAAGGDRDVTGDQLDGIAADARAANDEALAEAVADWTAGVRAGDAGQVDAATRRIAERCQSPTT